MALRDDLQVKEFPMHDLERAKAWFIQFKAKCKVKKLIDTPGNDTAEADFQMANYFLATCGIQALEKVMYIVQPRDECDTLLEDSSVSKQTIVRLSLF